MDCFLFFKQKTAYELRISDWSSDVCSSDLPVFGALVGVATRDRAEEQWRALASLSGHFLDVVRGLPTLVAHRRARAQSPRIRGLGIASCREIVCQSVYVTVASGSFKTQII